MPVEKYWTKERVIAAFHEYAEEHGRQPTSPDWLKRVPYVNGRRKYPATSQVIDAFGSWAEACEAAGFKPLRSSRRQAVRKNQRPLLEREEILEAMRQWKEKHRLSPTLNDWIKDKSQTHPSRVVRIFGSWGAALKAAGLARRPSGVSTRSVQKYLPLPRER